MASTTLHLLFDNLLLSQNIVSKRDYSLVHDWMDEFCLQKKDKILDVKDEVSGVKDCIMQKSNSTDEVELTDYLRVALGHLLLTVTWDNFMLKNEYKFLKLVFQRFMDSGFSNCYF